MKVDNHEVAARIGQSAVIWRGVRRAEPTLQIRRVMRAKSLRNIDVAERLGISEANVSRLLRGNQNLTIDTLYSLADAIDEPLTIFVGKLEAKLLGNESEGETKLDSWNTNSLAANNVIAMNAYRVPRTKSDVKDWSTYERIAIGR